MTLEIRTRSVMWRFCFSKDTDRQQCIAVWEMNVSAIEKRKKRIENLWPDCAKITPPPLMALPPRVFFSLFYAGVMGGRHIRSCGTLLFFLPFFWKDTLPFVVWPRRVQPKEELDGLSLSLSLQIRSAAFSRVLRALPSYSTEHVFFFSLSLSSFLSFLDICCVKYLFRLYICTLKRCL